MTYESAPWIGRCLASVRGELDDADEVIVVDNASQDETCAVVRRVAPSSRLLVLPSNRGFASAANRGAAQARGDFLLFLNPDATLCAGALRALIDYLAAHPAAAAAGGRLSFPNGSPQDSAFTYPTLLMTWLEFFPRPARLLHSRWNGRLSSPDGRPIEVDHPLGACMLVRRRAWEEVGPFDEGFFLYCEEVDWCMRARRLGWTIAHVPVAHAVHHGGASAASAPGPSLVHLYRSRRRLHRKYRPLWFRVLARLITCVGLAAERRRLGRSAAQLALERTRLAALEQAMHLAR